MPIAYIVASMRAALEDMDEAEYDGRQDAFNRASEQMTSLIDELEKHDGAKEKVAAND